MNTLDEHNGKRDTQAIEVTWDATGRTTAEWKIDLIKVEV